jgi:hypothetical protein
MNGAIHVGDTYGRRDVRRVTDRIVDGEFERCLQYMKANNQSHPSRPSDIAFTSQKYPESGTE